MANMWFAVLGPVQVWRSGVEVGVGAPQQRAVLAVLLSRAGHPVAVTEIVDVLWGANPPTTAVNAIHRSVGVLRRALEPGLTARDTGRWLVRAGGGYRLDVDADTVDLLHFRALLGRARADASVPLFRQALDLWQGPAAGTVAAEIRGRPVFTALDREYEAAAREAADAALAAGEPGTVLRAVELAADRTPLDEALQARLMLLLAGAGQQAAALRRYDTVRARLSDDLGIDPGPELAAAWDRVLRRPARPAVAPAPRRQPSRRVAQLPLDPSSFTGRGPELAEALQLLDDAAAARPTVVIGAISGMAGIGKTTLAVHWAHRVADRYPDGQLYLNLRGFGPSGQVMDPAEAAVRLLEALGVPPHRIPASLDARAALYRSELAGRRMLVLLDNARDTAQVRPLLPGAAGCLVLVTSRDRLAGLIASDGARPITLGPLSTGESRQLLVRRLGAARVGADRDAVEEILGRCAGLPLALAIVAARAATHPQLPMRELAAELRDESGRLDTLTTGDPDSDVRAVFSWSYRALDDAAARLFRLLGLHPGADIPVAAAASLAGLSPGRVRPLLGELVRTGLIAEYTPGRFAFHDLLRSYAADLVNAAEPDAERLAAGARLLDHYLHTAHRAALLLAPGRDPITLAAPSPGTTPEPLTGHGRALAWLTAEYRVLQAFIARLAGAGADTHTWQLAWTLDTFQRRQGHVHDQVANRTTALAAAQRLADPAVLADAHRDLGHALIGVDRREEARTHFTYAIDGYADLGDLVGQAHVERGVGSSYERGGQYDKALLHCLRAEELYRAAGNRTGLAKTLNETGFLHAKLGEFRLALPRCEQALALFRALGDRHGEAACLDSLAAVHDGLHDRPQAISHYQQSVDLWVQVGDRCEEAATLINLGDAHHGAGDIDAAGVAWRSALDILRDLDRPQVEEVEARLDGLSGAPAARRGTRA
ncbi:BTAD domain-containing putative transcriptional regulator [Dactylosporangium sp. NPDC049525]|uniref:AfsR/SARP family transcriptional regulator n=1 Tax=Dactylosporangium sp. NPDC049525 TaxID=3154730 RepID=UPI00342C5A64